MCGNICSKGMDSGSDGDQVHGCSCAAEQGGEDEIEKTSTIKLQYDKADADKLVYFGAKLNTNSHGVHRLVEVEEEGLAHQLQLRNDDVIIELNGADVTDVSHGALLLSLRDLGTKVQFIANRKNEGSFYQGAVYFRLGPTDAGGDARIVFQKIDFKEGEHHEHGKAFYYVFITRPILPPEETASLLDKYTLDTAQKITLQSTLDGAITNLNISKSKAQFTGNTAKVCKYAYTRVNSLVTNGTITAYASIPSKFPWWWQYGVLMKESGAGLLEVQTFPSCMKRKKGQITGNNFFFLLRTSNNVDISPVSNLGLHVTVGQNNQAVVATSSNSTLQIGTTTDCSRECIIGKAACHNHHSSSNADE